MDSQYEGGHNADNDVVRSTQFADEYAHAVRVFPPNRHYACKPLRELACLQYESFFNTPLRFSTLLVLEISCLSSDTIFRHGCTGIWTPKCATPETRFRTGISHSIFSHSHTRLNN